MKAGLEAAELLSSSSTEEADASDYRASWADGAATGKKASLTGFIQFPSACGILYWELAQDVACRCRRLKRKPVITEDRCVRCAFFNHISAPSPPTLTLRLHQGRLGQHELGYTDLGLNFDF